MLSRIRNRLFSTSAPAPTQRKSRRSSQSSRRRISNVSESSTESSSEKPVRDRASTSKRRTRSLSSVPRRDSKGKVGESASGKTTNHLPSGTSSKRANSLPMKKKRKEKQMAVEERLRIEPLSNKPNQSSAVNNENPWNERLGTQKVATWLLGSTDTNWAPMPVQVRPQQMQQQQMQQQVPPNYFTSHPNRSSRPAVVGRPSEPTLQSPIVATNQQSPPIYMNQEFAAKMQPPLPPPQLSSLVMGRNVGPQSGRVTSAAAVTAALGQPSMSSRMLPSHVPPYLLSPTSPQTALKSIWSASESRAPTVDYTVGQSAAAAARWPWTDYTSQQQQHHQQRINDLIHSEAAIGQTAPKSNTRTAKAVREKKDDRVTKKKKSKERERESKEKDRKQSKANTKGKLPSSSDSKAGKVKSLLPSGNKSRHRSASTTNLHNDKRSARAIKVKPFPRTTPNLVPFPQGGERVGWEYHTVALSRVPVYGFGIAVSGGRDNPHFMNGDPSIAISDVLKAGPAEGKLMVNDRVISVNGVSLENVDYNQAISVLRECGSAVNLLIKRRALVTQQSNGNATAEANNNPIKVTLTKANKKDDFGIVLGCKIYVKEITNRSAVNEKDVSLQEGDIIHKINSTSTEGITLKEARKLLESCKEKVSLVVARETTPTNPLANFINNRFLNENGNYINGHGRNNAVPQNGLFNSSNSHQRWPSSVGSDRVEQNAAPNGSAMVNGHSKENSFSGHNESNNNNNNNNSITSNGATVAANIAAMANGRANGNNAWSNQNLYVQPPTRAEYQQMNNSQTASNHPLSSSTLNDSGEGNSESNQPQQQHLNSSTISSRMRAPLADISLSQLDQPATPLLSATANQSSSFSATEAVQQSPVRPLPQRPSLLPNTTSTPTEQNTSATPKKDIAQQQQPQQQAETAELDEQAAGKPSANTAVRYISFHKEGSVGIRLTGGNEVGIFVTAVQPGSPASLQGLQVGDKILKANGTDMSTFTREEAVLYLLRIQDKIELIVQNCKAEYESIVAGQKGDSFYIRVHFNYDSDGGKGELSFHVGDIFHVVDTLHNGVVGSWLVYRLGRNNQEIQKGSIPNKSRADELATEQRAEGRSKKSLSGGDLGSGEGGASSRRGNFFKRRRSARRSKSLSKDHWEDVIFGDGSSKFGAYERVTLKNTGFTRPVVFFGPLADIAREKFLRDNPEKYACPRALSVNDDEETASKRGSSSSSKVATSGIVRLSSIKEVIGGGKHALLDITPSAVDRLNYAQFYPIVIFMRAENKSIVKELRSRSSSKSTVHRSSRKLFEQSLKLEKLWHHIFTASINLTSGGDTWYKKLHETIEKEQSNTIWMAESKPEESISDDFLFPMISRLSYASSPESDLDVSTNDCSRLDEDDDDDRPCGKDFLGRASSPGSSGRLVKASSDPSLARPLEQSNNATGAGAVETTDSTASTTPKNGSAKKESTSKGVNESPNQRSPSKQLPLHILLRKELSKALNYDSKDKDSKEGARDESNGSPSKAGNTSESELKQRRLSARQLDEIGNYPTLRASEKYPPEPVYAQSKKMQPHDQPPPPPSTLPPGTSPNNCKVKQQYSVESGPPRIDRNSKPSRFRSAHERLFGSKSIFASMVSNSSENSNNNNNSGSCNNNNNIVTNNNNSISNYQNDDSDYINTVPVPAPAKYEEPSSTVLPPPPPPQSPPPQQQQSQQQTKQSSVTVSGNTSSAQQRFVTGAFGDTSSYSSDSYNKYGSGSSTLEQVSSHQHGTATRAGQSSMPPSVGGQQNGEPYKPPRRSAPQLSQLSSKQSSLERSKPLPPPPFLLNGASKVEPPIPLSSTFGNKAPPSPPPKPASKLGVPSSSSLQYQMNSLSLSDNRPPPPPKPLSMPPPPMPNSLYDKQTVQSDYDNMPVVMANAQRSAYPAGPMDPSNGPPGYYQSLPQSSYAFHSAKHDGQPRYSSNAETISNFINGPTVNSGFSNSEPTYNSFSSLRRPPSSYLDMNGDPALGKPPPPPAAPEMSPSKLNTYSSASNYEHMRYPSITSSVYPNSSSSLGYSTTSQQHQLQHQHQQLHQLQSVHNPGPYLNVPYPSKSPYSHEVNLNSYPMGSNSSPLPPPPPLPPSFHGQGGHIGGHGGGHQHHHQHLVHPTPQQAHQPGQSYLDLSLNREHRGSAFEVYRKPEQSLHSESPLFHGLPPPPPPLTASDYNQPNYCNLDELTNSPMYLNAVAGGGNNGGGGGGDEGGHTDEAVVIAFAKGVFGCEGGTLVSHDTGVSLLIPPDAIPSGMTQEIYFKVCQDHSLAPPLDKSKGETLLSPIVMCGPRGLHFNVPVELRLPHCIDVDASWSVALKSKNASTGEASGWRSISINDEEGLSNNDFNDFNQQSVTVLIDHF